MRFNAFSFPRAWLICFLGRRFLRARRWKVEDAFAQFKDTEHWREANDIGKLYDTIDVEAYEQSRRLV
jgi:hypothetical protein